MMIYLGGGAMNIMYGGTIIDGTQISTRSVTANRIQANSITATELIQTESIIVNQAMIANATIGTLKVLDGGISGVYAGNNGTAAHLDTAPTVAFNALAGRRFLITYMGNDINAGRVLSAQRALAPRRECSLLLCKRAASAIPK